MDFFKRALADIGDIEIARHSIERKTPGITQPLGPNRIQWRYSIDVGIIRGNRVKRGCRVRLQAWCQPEHLAQQRVIALGVV